MYDDKNLIQMTVGGVTLDPVTKTPVVLLKDAREEVTLPIWVGLLEATAMATEQPSKRETSAVSLSVFMTDVLLLEK